MTDELLDIAREKNLPYDKANAVAFYEERYSRGYMDEWPSFKKNRVFTLIRQLGLPAFGRALDIGCGNGVFTDVIKQALPQWEVYGADISETALHQARARYPACQFFALTDETCAKLRFDFVFSHHVLEHVYNVHDFLGEVNARLQPRSAMLHICPCGNEGSLEDQISRMTKNGIDFARENRRFFEEPGHLRRLTTDDVINVVKDFGFSLTSEWYAQHYWGAVHLITEGERGDVKKLTNFEHGVDVPAQQYLKRLRREFLLLTYLRLPVMTLKALQRKSAKNMKDWIKWGGALGLYPLAKTVDTMVRHKGLVEWEQLKTDRRGGEMYLYFTRAHEGH